MNLLNYLLAVLIIIIPQVFTKNVYEFRGSRGLENDRWRVSILNNAEHVCVGSILSELLVLTATSCTEVPSLSTLTIRAGSSSVFSGGSVHKVVAATRYRNYSMSLQPSVHNLALLRVQPPFRFDENVEKVAKRGNTAVVPGSIVNTLSWGWMKIIQKITLKVVERCMGQISDEQICGFSLDGRFYESDIGGPLVVNGNLVGVLVKTSRPGVPYTPEVFTKISFYGDWIEKSSRALELQFI